MANKDQLDKVEQFSPSVGDERVEHLKKLFPDCFTEGKIDFEQLREVLGESTEEGPERYHFTWAGKRDAIQSLQTPTRATLVPCHEESVDFESTGNIFIEGDNLEVLKLLYKPYFGQVKAIYIDPPYNTGNDFVYPDNYTDSLDPYLQLTGQKDESGRGPWASTDLVRSDDNDPARIYEVISPTGAKFTDCWSYTQEHFQELIDDNRVWWGRNNNSKPKRKRFLKDKEGLTPRSWVDIALTSDGKEDLKKLDFEVFDYPKPVILIKHFLQIATKPSDLILDFFAGSCTTAQAVLELNREDGGSRRFIMVQLPEPTPEGSIAKNEGYETIADIGKERIRRVLAKIKEDSLFHESEDLGVRIFKLTESNYRLWNGIEEDGAESYAEQMQLFADSPLIEDWVPENVIYEVAIKEGYRLDSLIEGVAGGERNAILRVVSADKQQSFCICLEEELFQDELNKLGLTNDDLFVCLDQALDDTKAANLALQCRLKTI